LRQTARLTIEHPDATCSAEAYNRSRADLAKMMNALQRQIIYR